MDNELEEARSASVREHLTACEPCGNLCAELACMLYMCEDGLESDLAPRDAKRIWLGINNIIENEPKPLPQLPEKSGRRFLRLGIGQLAAALACIAIVSSLLTLVAIRNYSRPPGQPTAEMVASRSIFEKVLGRLGIVDTPQQARDRRLKEQQAAIDYWDARVRARRAQWDRITREAFDRNLQVIDESVNGYTLILQQDPDDDLSGEMLDSVLNEKMALLRDFSDL